MEADILRLMVIRSSKSGMAAIVMIVMAGIGTIASAAPPKKPTAKPAASAAPSASPAPSAAGTAAALDTTDKWTQGPGTGCADHYYRPPNTTTAVPCGAAHSCCT